MCDKQLHLCHANLQSQVFFGRFQLFIEEQMAPWRVLNLQIIKYNCVYSLIVETYFFIHFPLYYCVL